MTTKKKLVVTALVSAVAAAAVTVIVNNAILLNIDSGVTFKTKLALINSIIKSQYIYDDYDKNQMEELALTGYVEGLDEPYTHYYDPKTFSKYQDALEESYVGIGAVISVSEQDEITVVSTYEGSSSFESGVLPGDVIIAVEGQAYEGAEVDEAISKIREGKEGTTVTITFKRGNDTFDKTIERKRTTTNPVKSEMLENGIGYLKISEFNSADEGDDRDTYTEVKENIEKLSSEGMEKIIVDLRDNPGGSLDVVCNIADMFLPEGTITYMEYKDGSREYLKSDSNELNIPMVILINENSASASEVFTGAMKDYKRATVVGTKSFGKGVVQSVIPFADGSGMSVTVAKYFSPNGVCIHGTGIEPDVTIEMPEEYKDMYVSQIEHENDVQFQKALEILNK